MKCALAVPLFLRTRKAFELDSNTFNFQLKSINDISENLNPSFQVFTAEKMTMRLWCSGFIDLQQRTYNVKLTKILVGWSHPLRALDPLIGEAPQGAKCKRGYSMGMAPLYRTDA